MAEVMMAWGDFQFRIDSVQYDSLKTSMKWRWAKKDRVGRKPARQFQGPDAMTKTLPVAIYPQNKQDLTLLATLKQMGDKGIARPLVAGGSRVLGGQVVGAGISLGLWVLEGLDVTETQFMADGTPLELKGSITFAEWGEDQV